MRTELKQFLINKYDGNIPKYQGNLGFHIWVKEIDDYVINFLNNLQAITVEKYNEKPYKVRIKNNFYTLVVANGNHLGKRTSVCYIDSRIDDETMMTKVFPCLSHYCKEVKVF